MLRRFKSYIATRWIAYISDDQIYNEKDFRDWNNVYKDLTNSMIDTFYNSMKEDDA